VIRGRLGDEPEPSPEGGPEAESMQAHPTSAGAPSNGTPEAPPEPVTPTRRATPLYSVDDEPTPITKVRRSPVSASPTAEPAEPRPVVKPATSAAPDVGLGDGSEVALTVDELVVATGLTEARVSELTRYGLIAPRTLGGVDYFDADALAVAQAAAGFLQFGIEARHLKQFKSAAEREAGLFEQIVLPLLKQRNPAARRQAAESLEQLGNLGQSLRGALVRQAVRDITG
jgi:hypothetical protein